MAFPQGQSVCQSVLGTIKSPCVPEPKYPSARSMMERIKSGTAGFVLDNGPGQRVRRPQHASRELASTTHALEPPFLPRQVCVIWCNLAACRGHVRIVIGLQLPPGRWLYQRRSFYFENVVTAVVATGSDEQLNCSNSTPLYKISVTSISD